MEGHGGIFLLTFGYVLLLGMLAFLPFILQAVLFTVKNRQNDALLFCLTAAGCIIVFFSISGTKLPNYTVPAYPLIAVWVGVYLSRLKKNWLNHPANRIGLILYAIFLIIFPLGIYFGIAAAPAILHLTGLSYYFVILSLAGIAILYYGALKRNIQMAIHLNTSAWVVTILLFFYLIFPAVDAENPMRKILPQLDQTAYFVAYQQVNPAFVFALEREVPRQAELSEIRKAMLQHKKGYVISRTEYRTQLEQIPGLVYKAEARDIFEESTSLIMKWERH